MIVGRDVNIEIKDLERELAKMASRIRKDFTERGPVDTRVVIMNHFIILKFTAKFTKSEAFMLEHMQSHSSQIFAEYKLKLAQIMREDFSPVFSYIHLGLKIEDIETMFFGTDFAEQVTVFKMNKDVEGLLKNDAINMP
ncbi:Na-translocating system protein MpsC family protein [Paenibacillus sp. FSL K6-0108]|uniref:Na-translocating system protein MpsC family protein n=1 Tax=Paenibacillus sp. FSL K6-0108 TaxID=2921417 RepID=UPI00324C4E63